MYRFLILLLLSSTYMIGQTSTSKEWTESKVSSEEKFMEANTMIILGKYDEALKLLKELYKDESENSGLNFELAKVYGSTNDLASAIKHAKKAVNLNPSNEYYHLLLGNLLMDANQLNEAINSFQQLIIIQPENTEYYDMLAKAYLKTGNYESAIATFATLEATIGFSEDLALRQVDIYDQSGKSDKVITILTKLVEINPNEIRYLHNLASYYNKIGNLDKAKNVYKVILSIDPEDASANLALLDNPDNPSNEQAYLSALQPLIENDKIPLDKKILEMIPYLERLGSEPELAEPLLRIGKTLIQLYPEEAKVHAMYADIFNNLGQIDKAIDQYEKTLALDDKVYTVWEQLLLAYNQAEKYKLMESRAAAAVDLFPNKPSAYYLYASALIYNNKLDLAADYLDDASMISGKDLYHKALVENQLARLAMKQNKLDQAEKHLSISTELSMGQDPESVELYGDLSAMKNNISKAKEYWNKAIELGSTNAEKIEIKISKGSL